MKTIAQEKIEVLSHDHFELNKISFKAQTDEEIKAMYGDKKVTIMSYEEYAKAIADGTDIMANSKHVYVKSMDMETQWEELHDGLFPFPMNEKITEVNKKIIAFWVSNCLVMSEDKIAKHLHISHSTLDAIASKYVKERNEILYPSKPTDLQERLDHRAAHPEEYVTIGGCPYNDELLTEPSQEYCFNKYGRCIQEYKDGIEKLEKKIAEGVGETAFDEYTLEHFRKKVITLEAEQKREYESNFYKLQSRDSANRIHLTPEERLLIPADTVIH